MGRVAELGVVATLFTYAAHVLAVVAAVMVIVWCVHFRGGLAFESSNKALIFNVHPVFMLIGFIILGSEAILSYKILPFSKELKKVIHLTLHAIALVLGIVGIYAAFKFHNESAIDNLYSLHSWIGLGTICLYGIQWLFGLATFFYPGAPSTFRRDALPWHVLFGLLVYAFTITAAELGFLEKLTFLQSSSAVAKYGSEAFLVNFTALIVLLLGVSVFLSAILPAQVEQPSTYTALPES